MQLLSEHLWEELIRLETYDFNGLDSFQVKPVHPCSRHMKCLTWFDMAVNTHYLSEHVTVSDLSMHSSTSFLPSNWDSSHIGAAQAFKDKGIFTETGVKPPKCLSVIKWIILLLESSLDHNTAKLTFLMLLKSELFEESYQCALHQNTTCFLDCYFKQTAAGVWPCWFSMR